MEHVHLHQTRLIGVRKLARPVQLAVRAVLVALLAVAGAWACVAHCALLGSPHHSHGESNHQLAMHAHDEHMDGAHVASVPAVDGETASGSTSGAHCPPAPTVSALTVGVFLPIMLVLYLAALPARLFRAAVVLVLVAIPPPRRPPRISPSFAI